MGIWIFYYLKFTNYAGIGLIETALIVAMTLSEIPTGAVADLVGRKNTLIISFFLQAFGLFLFAFAKDFWWLFTGAFVSGIGGSFYSGTLDALVYDSLKQNAKENLYGKIKSNLESISLLAPAVCGVIGGFLYTISPSLPFLFSAIGYCFGLIFSLFLTEPKIDSEHFSFRNFVLQTKHGIHELFKAPNIQSQSLLLISVGLIIVIADEMLNNFLGVEFGFSPVQLSILWPAIYVLSAFAAQTSPIFIQKFKERSTLIIVGLLMAVSFMVSPYVGMIIGGLSLLFRSSLQSVYNSVGSVIINENTESKYRATTISTFNMFKNIPYVLTAYFFGSLADSYSAKLIAFILGIILFVLVIFQMGLRKVGKDAA